MTGFRDLDGDYVRIPTVRERGVPRRDPAPPDPRPAATAMLKARLPGNEATIDTAVFAVALVREIAAGHRVHKHLSNVA